MITSVPSEDRASLKHLIFWFFLSIVIWVYCFRGFLLGELSFYSDAVAYYDNTKFFVDNLVRGVYPLWDPTNNAGVPNEFFLRRLGSFNPFYYIIVVLRWAGIPHLYAYLSFLSIYWLTGCIGFWWLARRIFKHEPTAFLAYLLLLFSSVGTRLFDSFIILTFVPLIWFFAFLVAFVQTPRTYFLMGVVLALMQLFTTYIPLYFVTIFLIFLGLYLVIYGRDLPKQMFGSFNFLSKNKLLTAGLCTALLLSSVPACMLFIKAKDGTFVMPQRGQAAESTHALKVGQTTTTNWAIMEEFVYSKAFKDLRKFKFAIVFIPGFIYLLFLLGIVTRTNRRLLILLCWGGALLIIGMPGLTPVYSWLYKHVFFFKYFRNLHWFLWLAIIPIFILFVCEQFRQLVEALGRAVAYRGVKCGLITSVHLGVLTFLIMVGDTLISTYICLLCSNLFFVLLIYRKNKLSVNICFLYLLLIICIQSVEVYTYLNKNSVKSQGGYRYDSVSTDFSYERNLKASAERESIYYALRDYYSLNKNVKPQIFNEYMNNKFIVYDKITVMDPMNPDFSRLSDSLRIKENLAYVSNNPQSIPNHINKSASPQYRVLDQDTSEFEIKRYQSNQTTVEINFSTAKFLVYLDNYHDQWNVYINKRKAELIRTNHTFKGVWIPAGHNTVSFQYGSFAYRALNYSLMFLFLGMCLGILWIWSADLRKQGDAC